MSWSNVSSRSFIERALVHLPALRRVGRRLTGSAAEADDLVQETVARALERRGELRDPERLKGWLLAVQRTVFLNSRRGLRPHLEVLEGGLGKALPAEPSTDMEAELHARTLSAGMQAALDSLAPEWRDALWLREVEELSYEEIARVQGCPVGTVRSRLARARLAMLDLLEKEKAHGSL
ncbi:RNA polymerase sigma factor [Corallococcus sp. AS-1-6]|nr:RNA polymerase sigma factor [Corallococcus sp. AS-1-6]